VEWSTHRVVYEVPRPGRPAARYDVEVAAGEEEVAGLVADGYLLRRGLLGPEAVARYREAIDALTDAELASGCTPTPGNGYYLRDLLDKGDAFDDLADWWPTASVARAVLGPQVAVRVDARVAFEGDEGAGLPWHLHMPVVPTVVPPFFSHPHQVHVLAYLDPVTPEEGELVLAPGTHTDPAATPEGLDGGSTERFTFDAGDAVIVHGNLWHRTEPASRSAGRRRLLFVGYCPAWMRHEHRPVPGQPGDDRPWPSELRGGFRW